MLLSSNFFSATRLFSLWSLTKPRVLFLIVFCALVGMFLALSPHHDIDLFKIVSALVGIWLVAASAAVLNCLVEFKADALMKRTSDRPLPQQKIHPWEALFFSFVIGVLGILVLHLFVNDLTVFLTLLTFLGYALFYTLLLKPYTPQNIVIGGASGAMPPVLGWAAVSHHLSVYPWILFLIIFLWTPPHFWSLSLYRKEDYYRAGFPMLPVTHGEEATLKSIVLYVVLLFFASFLPCVLFFSGWLYALAALVLGFFFLFFVVRLLFSYSDALSRFVFFYSIFYLFFLFLFLLFDHWCVFFF